MLVECPYCHRKYEPKPNEKYCPCCGEEIKTPLKPVSQSNGQPTTSVITSAPAVSKKPIIGKVLFIIASCLTFLSFVFMFGPAVYTGSASIISLTFLAKDGYNHVAYIGLIIAFVAYAIMYIVNIVATVSIAKGEQSGATTFVGIMEICLAIFYVFYLSFRFLSGSSGYYSNYALGDASIKFIVSLTASAVLYFIAPSFNK